MSVRTVTLAGYLIIAFAATVWQAACIHRHELTLGGAISWLTRSRSTRIVLLIGWAWLGWHLFVRGTAAFLAR
ncbi:MAG: DUF6186 family protein [Acidimicrobiales bacterium]